MDIDTLLDSLIQKQSSTKEEFIINSLVSEGIREPKKQGEDAVVELALPPLDEAAFFTKILWETLYPNEPTVDSYFNELVTRIVYNVADSGKLHKALVDWIVERLMEKGKASDVSTAENMAESLLDESESYTDLMDELRKPKVKPVVKQ